jgi:hypothetical protein
VLAALAVLAVLALTVAARPVSAHEERSRHMLRITCETVRAYVAEVGLVNAKAMAIAHGMTAAQEREAKRCLE